MLATCTHEYGILHVSVCKFIRLSFSSRVRSTLSFRYHSFIPFSLSPVLSLNRLFISGGQLCTDLEVRIHLLLLMSVFVHELNDPFLFFFSVFR